MKRSHEDYEVTYCAESRIRAGHIRSLIILVTNLRDNFDLVYELFTKNFYGTYRKSALGLAWLFLAPLVGILSWAFLNFTGLLQPGDVGIPYPAFVLTSFTLWSLFAGFAMAAAVNLEGGAGFISQVEFPYEVLFVQQSAGFLAGFIVNFIINIIVLFAYSVVPDWKIVLLPLLVLPLFLLGGGVGLVLSVFGAVAEDVKRILILLINLLVFITPVVYGQDTQNPLLQKVMKYNPLSTLISVPRDLILFGHADGLQLFFIIGFCCLVFFIVCWRFYYVSVKLVVEEMY